MKVFKRLGIREERWRRRERREERKKEGREERKREGGRKEYEGIVTNLMQFLLELAVLHFKCA